MSTTTFNYSSTTDSQQIELYEHAILAQAVYTEYSQSSELAKYINKVDAIDSKTGGFVDTVAATEVFQQSIAGNMGDKPLTENQVAYITDKMELVAVEQFKQGEHDANYSMCTD